MRKTNLLLSAAGTMLLLAGCAVAPSRQGVTDPAAAPGQATRPAARPDTPAPPPPEGARTVEQFDTTSLAERQDATRNIAADWRVLGRTVATLGDPADPGFWAKTPLVEAVRPGRLVDPSTGASVRVELRPLAAEPGAGSQVSLAAFRQLAVPLTALRELSVETR